MKDRSSPSSKKPKTERRSIRQRVGDGARTLGEIGDDIAHRPRVLPGKALRGVRRWVLKLWKVRGGGLYAAGYVVTFTFLEVRSIILGFGDSEGVVDFLTSEILEFFFRFLGDSISNMVSAFLWPLAIIKYRPPVGIAVFVASIFLFEVLLRKRIERWLSDDTEEPPA